MKLTKALLLFLIFQNLAGVCFSQQNLVYNHYFVNPYLYNPSYAGSSGYSEISLNARRTWAGFAGAPQTATLNVQVPLSYKISVGFNGYADEASFFKAYTGYGTFAYQIFFGKNFSKINKLGFGLSAGYSVNKIDLSSVSNPDDPVYKTLSSGKGIQGQFGLNYQYQNFKIGFALPRLLKSRIFANTPGDSAVSPLQSTISTVSYNFQLGSRVAFEPYVLYHTDKNLPSYYEVLGVLKIDNIGWIGGAYRSQHYGASAFFGLNLKEKLKFGYAYEFAPNQVTSFGGGSHEIQLILRLSKRKKERPAPVEKITGDMVEEPEEETPADTTAIVQHPDIKEEEPVIAKQESEVSKEEARQSEPVGTNAESQPQEETPEVKEISTVNPGETKPETRPVTKTLDGVALPPGHYVVVGAFRSMQNAKTFSRTLKTAGYPASVAFNPDKRYYIVHMGVTASMDEALKLRDVYRQKSRYSFKDTWILTIE